MSRVHSFILIAIVACAASGFGSTFAADATATPSEPPKTSRAAVFEQIDRLNTENALLAARTANAKLRKQLLDAEAGRDGAAPATQQVTMPQPYGAAYSTQPTPVAPRTALVLFVGSAPNVNGGKPTALIQLPDGSRINRGAGGQVPGLGVLRTVSVSEVTAFDGKKVVSIPFEGGDSTVGGR